MQFFLSFIVILFSISSFAKTNSADDYPIPFESERKWGAKNQDGVIVIPPIYKNILLFKGGVSAARVDMKIGYIDQNGKIAIPFEYDKGLNLSNGLVGVCTEGKCGYLDKKGNVIIPLLYKKIDYFREDQGGLAIVNGERGWGVIDKTGREIIETNLYEAPSISGDLIVGYKAPRDGMIYDLKGNVLTRLPYDIIAYNVWAGKYLNDNLYTVSIDGKWGFINKSGKVVIPIRYDKRAFFYRGYTELTRGGKVYCVDKNGTEKVIRDR